MVALSLNHLLQPPGHGLHQVLHAAVVRHPGDPELHNLPLPVLHVCADIFSWLLMAFRGTLAHQSSIAALLSALVKGFVEWLLTAHMLKIYCQVQKSVVLKKGL